MGIVVTILIFAKTNGFQYEVNVASNLHHRTQKTWNVGLFYFAKMPTLVNIATFCESQKDSSSIVVIIILIMSSYPFKYIHS